MNDDNKYDYSPDHVLSITDRELELTLLKMGAFLSIVQNKKCNYAKLLISAVNEPEFQDIFLDIAELETPQQLVRYFIEKCPSVCESRVVYRALKR